MIHDSTDEHQQQVLQCALALKTLHNSGRIKTIALKVSEENEEFVEDVNMTLQSILENDNDDKNQDDRSEPEDNEGCQQDSINAVIAMNLKLINIAIKKMMKKQIEHEKALKYLLSGKL